jgi:hypothetical protein
VIGDERAAIRRYRLEDPCQPTRSPSACHAGSARRSISRA